MATSTITGTITSGVSLTAGTYTNPVTIAASALVSGGTYGVAATDSWAVDNFGGVSGGAVGILLSGGGTVTNEMTGTIAGGIIGIQLNAAGAVENFGTITGGGVSGYGVSLNAGGTVTNAASASIYGAHVGVDVEGDSATLMNAGTIAAYAGLGVGLDATTDTLVNTGVISSKMDYGVAFGFYGSTVQSATLENAGTITGNSILGSVDMFGSDTDRLIVDPGAVFIGAVLGGPTDANSTIELKAGSSVGTISGLGTQYKYFQTVTIDGGAAWNVGGAATYIAANMTIEGFNNHDRLDLTDLTFNANDTATVNGSDQLVITDTGGNVTIQMDSNVSEHLFTLVQDSTGDTFVEESDYTPCYCRGTRIRTPKGEVAVEALKIGDHIVTVDGAVLPIKWIGRRNYRDWLAVGDPDAQPILFKAGSIADHVPTRDLLVSPEHAMFLDGMLIPAQHLVNGVSILKVEGMEEIEYFHLEFDRHVVIYAEGAAAESFADDDSRMLFHNADEHRRLYPDEPRSRYPEFCAPRVESGHALETLHHRLTARAARLLPDGTAAPASVQQGYLDRATRAVVEGWAIAGAGEAPVKLAIILNGAVIGQTLAEGYRADLAKAGVGDGQCGFRFDLPHGLSSDIAHRIEVRRESDWSPLIGGCVTLDP